MQIIINGKSAKLKEGSSFDFVAENRSFTGSDSYTMSITFPLAGCSQNLSIFGNVNRKDVKLSKVIFDCELRDRDFSKVGIITITEINETEVQTQFLEGRSEQNYKDYFDDVYINELELGSAQSSEISDFPDPTKAWKSIDDGANYVALPWYNNTAGSTHINNRTRYSNGQYEWHADTNGLSWMPYLIWLVKRIFSVQGYSYDFSDWESSSLRHIIVCNSLSYDWNLRDFARALPRWSVTEFIENLENFLNCELDVDHKSKFVKFSFSSDVISTSGESMIDPVVKDYAVDVTEKDESQYHLAADVSYSDNGSKSWKYQDCQWFINAMKGKVVSFDSVSSIVSIINKLNEEYYIAHGVNTMESDVIWYARDVDTYFTARGQEIIQKADGSDYFRWTCILQPLNQFGKRSVIQNNENSIELKIVPANIEDTNVSGEINGSCVFLNPGSYSESAEYLSSDDILKQYGEQDSNGNWSIPSANYMNFLNDAFLMSIPEKRLSKGEKTKTDEYYDKLFVGFWDGQNRAAGYFPFPYTDSVTVINNSTVIKSPYSLRINNASFGIGKSLNSGYQIEPTHKYSFSFLSRSIPNVRALFYIEGKKYVCKKITVNFTENGRSQLTKGEFYRVIDTP